MIYKAMYKCRLCGKVYDSGTATGNRKLVEKAMYMLVIMGKISEPQAPSMQTVHFCDSFENGNIGVADFIGWKEEPDT